MEIEVAKIGRAVGLKGTLKLHLTTDFAEQFRTGIVFHTKIGDLEITSYSAKQGEVSFKGYNSKEEASRLTNLILYSTPEETRKHCSLSAEEYFWFDMIGVCLYEDDLLLGCIDEIQRIGATDYFLILTDQDLIAKGKAQRFMFPYLDHTILDVDLPSKRMNVTGALDILDAL